MSTLSNLLDPFIEKVAEKMEVGEERYGDLWRHVPAPCQRGVVG